MEHQFNNIELIDIVKKYENKGDLLLAIDELLASQKSKMKSIQDEYDRLSVIIDLIPNTISWVKSDMTYFGVNRALSESCGVAPEDFLGKNIGFLTKESFFYEFVCDLFKSTSNTIYRQIETNHAGIDRTYLVSGTKLADKKKAVVIGVDITELSQIKEHLSFTEKLSTLGEMFAGIIHDINNPLMMIENNAKRIKKRIQDEDVLDYVTKIEMSSKKISKIVQGIKIYIRQDDQQPFEVEKLGNILDDAITICEHKLKENKIEIRIDPRLRELLIKCNFTQIFQVFVNLITNGIDAISTLPDKWIELTLIDDLSDTNKFKILILDSGTGIPMDIQNKIFQAFYTTKGRGIGSGLGLSLCKNILESHGGNLSIDNSKNHTAFLIEFPMHSKA